MQVSIITEIIPAQVVSRLNHFLLLLLQLEKLLIPNCNSIKESFFAQEQLSLLSILVIIFVEKESDEKVSSKKYNFILSNTNKKCGKRQTRNGRDGDAKKKEKPVEERESV